MMVDRSRKSVEEVIRKDGRYPVEAYAFLHEGLNRAVAEVHGPEAAMAPPAEGQERTRHVTGVQLCKALRDLSIERWGLLVRTVLDRWNIHATIDFGHMVYLLVDNDLMRKTEEDSVEDFRDVYAFDQAFNVKVDAEIKE